MAQELIYTSAPSGLRGGAGGFCTVAYTEKMPLDMVQLLESLSAYKPAFAVHDLHAGDNPIAYSHFVYTIKLQTFSILSRIAPTLADHTQRDNKLAHHVVLTRRELIDAGPGALINDPEFFCQFWDETPHFLAEREIPKLEDAETLFASTWQEYAGDAGWAGVLARHSIERPRVPAFIIYKPQTPVASLFKEALALMPPAQRWKITFSTYFFYQPAGTTCLWRGCIEGSSAVKEAKRQPQSLIIDLTQPLPTLTQQNIYIDCARGVNTDLQDKNMGRNPANRTRRLPYQGDGTVKTNNYSKEEAGANKTVKNSYIANSHNNEESKSVKSFLNRWKDN